MSLQLKSSSPIARDLDNQGESSSARSSATSTSKSSRNIKRPNLPGQPQADDEEIDYSETETQQREDVEDDDGSGNEEAWREFGNDTEAGRLLAKLYGGSKKVTVNYPAVRTRRRSDSEIAPFIPGGGKLSSDARTANLPKENSRRGIAVPSRVVSIEKTPLILNHKGRRRTSTDIQQTLDEIRRKIYAYKPMPAREMSTDTEKLKLQSKFHFDGGKALPAGALPGKIDPTSLSQKTRATLKEKGYERKAGLDLYELFDSVAAEIQEREIFLAEMRQLGQADQYEDKLKKEMKERFQELERINRLISEEEK